MPGFSQRSVAIAWKFFFKLPTTVRAWARVNLSEVSDVSPCTTRTLPWFYHQRVHLLERIGQDDRVRIRRSKQKLQAKN